MKKKLLNNELVIYQAKNGAIELREDLRGETIWATQAQIVDIFEIDQSVASRHINNVFKDGEVSKESNMQKMHIANSDKPITFYSLDVVLAVGYRANSSRAISFRQWATKTLREHIVDGYTLNKKVIARNLDASRITPEALTALTLLVAESNPKDKDRIIGLTLMILGK